MYYPSGMDIAALSGLWRVYPTADLIYSDGIARVHGMNNVQAEELVE